MFETGYIVFSSTCYFDLKRGIVFKESGRDIKRIVLARNPYYLLSYLVKNEGIILTKNDLIDAVWGPEYDKDYAQKSLANAISFLRKLDDSLRSHIHTIRGVGYKFEREKIYEMRRLAIDKKFSKEHASAMLSKYLNAAVVDRIEKLEKKTTDLVDAMKNDQLSEKHKNAARSELTRVLGELTTLKTELYSDTDISRILGEPDLVVKTEKLDVDAPFSLCVALTEEIRDLEEKISSLKNLKNMFCQN